jgi:hypothetical protein
MGDARENSRHGHAVRPGPFRRERAWWLHGNMLRWRIGSREGQVRLADIASLRLHERPGPQGARHCVVVEKAGRTHHITNVDWPGGTWARLWELGRPERRDASFRALAFTLARRLGKAAPGAVLLMGPSRGEWIASWVVAGLGVGMLALGVGLMVAHGRFEPAAAAFLGVLVFTLPVLWPVLRSGGPRPLDPATLHEDAGGR